MLQIFQTLRKVLKTARYLYTLRSGGFIINQRCGNTSQFAFEVQSVNPEGFSYPAVFFIHKITNVENPAELHMLAVFASDTDDVLNRHFAHNIQDFIWRNNKYPIVALGFIACQFCERFGSSQADGNGNTDLVPYSLPDIFDNVGIC